MDKYEYQICADQIKLLIDERRYAEAMNIADTIDWRKVRSVSMLCTVSEVYKINKKYEEARDILMLAYDRYPNGRTIVYALCELAIKLNDVIQAKELYEEFVMLAPEDTSRYILLYKLYEALDVSLEERIEVLEEFKKRDYRERWAYELAYLYHKIGQETRCVEECDELILWFGDGKYVKKAMDLKLQHTRLSKEQQLKYEGRQEPISDNFMKLQQTPVQQIYDTDPQAGNPQQIPIQPYGQQSAQGYSGMSQMQGSQMYMQGQADQQPVQGQQPMQDIQMQQGQQPIQGMQMQQGQQPMQNMQGIQGQQPMQGMQGMQGQQSIQDMQMQQGQQPMQGMQMQQGQQSMQDPQMQMTSMPVQQTGQRTVQMLNTSEIDSIQVKPVNVGMYNTIDLQNGLSENIKKFFESEAGQNVDESVMYSANTEVYGQLYENDTMGYPTGEGPVIQVTSYDLSENEMDDVPGEEKDDQITTFMPSNEQISSAAQSQTEVREEILPVQSDSVNVDMMIEQDAGVVAEIANEAVIAEEVSEAGTVNDDFPAEDTETRTETEAEESNNEGPDQLPDELEEELIRAHDNAPVRETEDDGAQDTEVDPELGEIYKDWEEKKRENEERRIQEAKLRSLVQTSDIMAQLKGVLPEIDDIAKPTPPRIQFGDGTGEIPGLEPVFKPAFSPSAALGAKPAAVSIHLPEDELSEETVETETPAETKDAGNVGGFSEAGDADGNVLSGEAEKEIESAEEPEVTETPEKTDAVDEYEEETDLAEGSKEAADTETGFTEASEDTADTDSSDEPEDSETGDVMEEDAGVRMIENIDDTVSTPADIDFAKPTEPADIEPDVEGLNKAVEEAILRHDTSEIISEEIEEINRETESVKSADEYEAAGGSEDKEQGDVSSDDLAEEQVEEPVDKEDETDEIEEGESRPDSPKNIPAGPWRVVPEDEETEEETQEEESPKEELTEEPFEDNEEAEAETEEEPSEESEETETEEEPSEEIEKADIDDKPVEEEPEEDRKIEVVGATTNGEFGYLGDVKSNDDLYFREIMNIEDPEEEENSFDRPVMSEKEAENELTYSEDEEAARRAAFEVTSELPKYPYEELDDYGEVEEIEVIEQPEGLDGIMKTSDIPLDAIAQANYEAGLEVEEEEEEERPKKTSKKKKHPSYMKLEDAKVSKRDFDKEEQLVFGRFAGIEWLKAQIVNAVDNISMEPSKGNVIVMGPETAGRRTIAIDVVKVMQMLETEFKGKVAKISGEALNKKDIPLTLKKLRKGALIIENAGGLTASSARIIAEALELETEPVLVVMEGDKESVGKLINSSKAIMNRVFNARINLQDYSTDDLVAYGKGYVREQEYTIDEMGVLALYRRIGDMQTLDHVVTLEEVREILDNAIKHVDKKNMSHFMDVILAKRYDDDDFIILREKDFIS